MIINGGARKSGGFFARHLMKAEENERVEIKEMRGLYAEDLPEAFREMRLLAAGSKAENYFYHANVNPREDEQLTAEQWQETADTLERNLGLADHPRIVIEHSKNGRTHQHYIWSRVDMDTGMVTPVTDNYYIHTQTARELEQAFHLSPVQLPSPPERDRIKDWESFRGQDSGIDPKEMKAQITELWQQSDGGRAFQAAMEEKGYLLAKGDRRDFILIDPAGDIHSLARRIDGAKAVDIRAKMGDLDRESLMGAKEASAWMKGKEEAENSGESDARILPEEQAQEVTSHNPKLTVLEKYAHDHPAGMLPDTEGYVALDSPEAFTKYYAPHFAAALDSSQYWDKVAGQGRERQAWDDEQARLAKIPESGHHLPDRDADAPHGEPPIELTSFERATHDTLPPRSYSGREQNKRENETWLEFVTRTQPPDRMEDKGKTHEKEPEPER